MTTEHAKSHTLAQGAGSTQQAMVGRYRIIGRLGKGGMAEVLLALQHDTTSDFKRLVVVKRVLAELEREDPQFIQMFLDEARLAARLSHADVVQTYEVGQDGDSPFLAMEFLDGQSVNVLQRRARSLKTQVPVDVALRIFCDALEGLHYAHELRDFDGKPLNVIHRDVTPSNLFVKYDGTTKLVDFGIAKSATQREKTRAGILKGKMAYMAPEQLRDEPVSRSVDVWALGIVLWETLAGERLFRGKNDFETVQAVMTRELPKLSAVRSDVPASLDAVLAKAIERDASKRVTTAADFKTRLEDEAFRMGKPLRGSEVAKTMHSLFGDVVEYNQKIVKAFLEKANPDDAAQEYLRVKSTGALEVRAEEVAPDPNTRESSSPSETLSDASGVSHGDSSPSRRSLTNSLSDRTMVESRSQVTGKLAQESLVDQDLDDEPRPAWHWIVLAVALLSVGLAVWYLMS